MLKGDVILYVKYVSSIGSPKRDRCEWVEEDNSCFNKVIGHDAWVKEVYFYPQGSFEGPWLWVLGHEKATRDKAVINRIWTSWWGFHICVGGKGYYNDIPITRGTCFLSWPYIKHNIVADEKDPLEFYWLIIKGANIVDLANDCGFSDDQLVYTVDRVDEIVNLFEQGINANYKDIDVYADGEKIQEIRGNYLSLLKLPLNAEAKELRIVWRATNGAPTVKLFGADVSEE